MEANTDCKLLVVEDEPALRETLEYNLTRQGYQVATAADGREAVEIARRERPDLIELDIIVQRLDGFEVCGIVRREMSVPVLMLTAKTDEVDKVVGLEVGADGYITKPFSMRELLACIKATLRRERLVREQLAAERVNGVAAEDAGALTFGDLTINTVRCEIQRRGQVLHMKPKEYDLLLFLARNRGMVLSRDLIMQRVWGWDYVGSSRTVGVHIRWLREKIEQDASNPERIVTVRGTGYLVEYGSTKEIFTNPKDQRTEDYITGRFG